MILNNYKGKIKTFGVQIQANMHTKGNGGA
jgi:hypothetical protein